MKHGDVVTDIGTVQKWIERLGLRATSTGPQTLQIAVSAKDEKDEKAEPLPPFFIQCGENWLMMSILPVIKPSEAPIDELFRQLLFANRDMRIAKFALGQSDDIILCAELPTESLDFPEFADALQRLAGYCKHYRDFLTRTL